MNNITELKWKQLKSNTNTKKYTEVESKEYYHGDQNWSEPH